MNRALVGLLHAFGVRGLRLRVGEGAIVIDPRATAEERDAIAAADADLRKLAGPGGEIDSRPWAEERFCPCQLGPDDQDEVFG